MTEPRLALGRFEILAYRRMVGSLDERLPAGKSSLGRAAWAGLQDSMPRAAVLLIHARVKGTTPFALEDPSLVQVWGPRYSTYVVAAADRAIFTLGRLPDEGKARLRAEDTANRLDAFLAGRAMGDVEAGRGVGVHPSALRYGAPTGRIPDSLGRGAPADGLDHASAGDGSRAEARHELVRRYLHVFGPGTQKAFAAWAGISAASAQTAFAAVASSLVPVQTPIGAGWILAADEVTFRGPPLPAAPARLLPSGDTFFLLQGADREVLVLDADRRGMLWTSRVWPVSLPVEGEVVGTWRRSQAVVSVEPWRKLTVAQRHAIEEEAASMPLPGSAGSIRVRWPL